MRRVALLAGLTAVVIGAFVMLRDDPEPGVMEVRGAVPLPAETIHGASGQLLTVKQWTPDRDVVLMCENWSEYLPMRPADLWVETVVPTSGRVLVVVSAQTSNSDPGLGDYWALMVGDEVVAQRQVGVGNETHLETARFVVDDLPAGETVRIDVAHRSDEGGTANLYVGPRFGPAVIEVWSA